MTRNTPPIGAFRFYRPLCHCGTCRCLRIYMDRSFDGSLVLWRPRLMLFRWLSLPCHQMGDRKRKSHITMQGNCSSHCIHLHYVDPVSGCVSCCTMSQEELTITRSEYVWLEQYIRLHIANARSLVHVKCELYSTRYSIRSSTNHKLAGHRAQVLVIRNPTPVNLRARIPTCPMQRIAQSTNLSIKPDARA
jgi:hypothetical protein